MSAVSRFFLATMAIFIVGMALSDPDTTNRPVQIREASLGYGVFEQADE